MEVRQVMSPAVITVSPDDDVKKAASLICLRKISGLPVVEDNKPVGMISEKDILRAIYPTYQEFFENPEEFKVFADLRRRYGETTNLKVKQIFSRRVITVEPDTNLLRALSLMVTKRVRRLPVVDKDGNILGIVSQGDIHQALFNEQFLIEK
ncbi:MAG: signal transduction protein [Firmicutes bacterium HGW-Firmicutes-14]|nr:MAG: signal transduction protein [Firmicutes bacterium HGW-Firmicutes-14]